LVNFVVKWTLKIPLHFAHVARVPCETLVSAKQAIIDKLQGSVATHLRWVGLLKTNLVKANC